MYFILNNNAIYFLTANKKKKKRGRKKNSEWGLVNGNENGELFNAEGVSFDKALIKRN